MATAQADNPLVMPYPRDMQVEEGTARIGAVTVLADDPAAKKAARVLKRGLKALGLASSEKGYPVSLVVLDETDANLGEEFYHLRTGAKGAVLAAATYEGLYYAVQTLLQLLEPQPGGKCALPAVEVTDWPLLQLRGIHTYLPGRAELPFFKRFIEWLGRHKVNAMFLEVGAGMEYKRHPEVNRAWEEFCKEAMAYPGGPNALQASQWNFKNSTHVELGGGSFLTQEEVKQIIGWCEENCIEIMPEMQSLSHSYYLARAYPEIAEVKDDPWPDNYCPSNPRSYELYFALLEEVLEVFQPRLVHIGHDEAYLFGICPKCKGLDAAETYANDIIKVHDYLTERGVRTAIWGDKLLEIHHPNGVIYGGVERNVRRYGKLYHLPPTNRCVDLLPKDILILDWYWSLSYESAAMLRAKGFELIYGNFHGPAFKDWAKHRRNPALLGGEMSLWCANDPYSIGKNGTFHNLLWGSNDLWSDCDPDAERARLSADIARVMQRERPFLTGKKSVVQAPTKKRFKAIDLTPGSCYEMYPSDAPKFHLGSLPRDRQTLAGVEFFLPPDDRWITATPSVNWHLRTHPPIPVKQQADALAFLHTTTVKRVHAPSYYSLGFEPNTVAHYVVTYVDGKQVEVPLEYGVHIDAFNCRFMAGLPGDQSATLGTFTYQADPALSGETEAGEPYTLFMYEWVNPRPKVAIRDVYLVWEAGFQEGIVTLVALTAVQGG
jgi:hypothetical protein